MFYISLINHEYKHILNNKLIFHNVMENMAPKLHGIILDGRFLPIASGKDRGRSLLSYLKANERLVIKSITGGHGKTFQLILYQDDQSVKRNGELMSTDEFEATLSELNPSIVTEYIQQADYSARIFHQTANTVRVVTCWLSSWEGPEIVAAVHRFGTNNSFPVDNWSRGGICASVDVQSGQLGPAVAPPMESCRECRWYKNHPVSQEPIEGFVIPGWERISRELLDALRRVPLLHYAGWDVLVTNDGFKLIEGNNIPDVDLIQVHRPLMANDRAKEFFQWYGISA